MLTICEGIITYAKKRKAKTEFKRSSFDCNAIYEHSSALHRNQLRKWPICYFDLLSFDDLTIFPQKIRQSKADQNNKYDTYYKDQKSCLIIHYLKSKIPMPSISLGYLCAKSSYNNLFL